MKGMNNVRKRKIKGNSRILSLQLIQANKIDPSRKRKEKINCFYLEGHLKRYFNNNYYSIKEE